ncbi:hypothetical protein MsAg5_01580 [Methanosarcinaceae archaeon Ag5]|uniref:Exosome complex component Csl4 n=1 Tax=Methanolapillus africanus TaxID=3028297 RepID=A0AAE4MJK4_9EURY|nr:hypothetical protein [Methanosarcinaceae archaeon Ag5]
MSRVQKKPIRRKLKDVSSKTEEPKDIEDTQFERETECAAPVQSPSKSQIPRTPRPQIEARDEAFVSKPVRGTRERVDRSEYVERPERSERTDRPERFDRTERLDRVERTERTDRPERTERTDRPERTDRGDRPERSGDRNDKFGDRNGRFGDRNGGDRGSRDRNGRDGGRGGRDGGRGGRDGKRPEKKKRPEKVIFENTKVFAMPGDIIGAVEEFNPAFGAVNDDGCIRATVSGFVAVNIEKRLVTIIPKTNTPNTIADGDIVIASVTDVRESNARVEVVAAEKKLDGEIVNNGTAEIYVSNIKDGFTKMVSDEFSVMDIVRAKVIDSSKIGLSTVDADLGVIKAYCSKCKASLVRADDILVCPVCGNRERRKLADSYGKGISVLSK